MKTNKKMSKLLLLWCIVAPVMLFAQGNNDWQLGGNDNGVAFPWLVNPANNFFGTTGVVSGGVGVQPVRMGTNGISRIFMSTTAGGSGFIGIGNNFLQPKNRLHQHDNDVNLHQFTNNK